MSSIYSTTVDDNGTKSRKSSSYLLLFMEVVQNRNSDQSTFNCRVIFTLKKHSSLRHHEATLLKLRQRPPTQNLDTHNRTTNKNPATEPRTKILCLLDIRAYLPTQPPPPPPERQSKTNKPNKPHPHHTPHESRKPKKPTQVSQQQMKMSAMPIPASLSFPSCDLTKNHEWKNETKKQKRKKKQLQKNRSKIHNSYIVNLTDKNFTTHRQPSYKKASNLSPPQVTTNQNKYNSPCPNSVDSCSSNATSALKEMTHTPLDREVNRNTKTLTIPTSWSTWLEPENPSSDPSKYQTNNLTQSERSASEHSKHYPKLSSNQPTKEVHSYYGPYQATSKKWTNNYKKFNKTHPSAFFRDTKIPTRTHVQQTHWPNNLQIPATKNT